MKKLMFMLTVAACAAQVQADAVPQGPSFAYQGCVVDSKTGRPKTEPFKVKISLYAGAKDTSPLWFGSFRAVPATNGVFNVTVTDAADSEKKLEDVLSSGEERYLGLTVENEEILVRQRLLPVPSAIYAQKAGKSSGNFTVSKDLIVGGGISVGGCTLSDKGEFNSKRLVSNEVTADKLDVTGATTVRSTLTAAADAVFKDSVTIEGTTVTATNAQLSVKSLLVGGAAVSLPVGTIVMWYGAVNEIPSGWALCNGDNNTPNLCGRFPLGASADLNNRGSKGGTNEVMLTVEQMPPHDHEYFGDDMLINGAVRTVRNSSGYDASSCSTGNARYYATSKTPAENTQKAVSFMPPYCTVYFIMKIK